MRDCIFEAEGDEEAIVSVGPHLSGGMDLFRCIGSNIDPDFPCITDAPLHQFDIAPECSSGVTEFASPALPKGEYWDETFFFSRIRSDVASMVLPFMAPKVEEPGVFAVAKLTLLEVREPLVRVSLEAPNAQAQKDAYCLTPSLLTLPDLQTVRVWQKHRIHYGFVHDICPDKFKNAEQEFLCDLMHARRALNGKLVIQNVGGAKSLMIEAAQRLEGLGYVHCSQHSSDDLGSTWDLNALGQSRLFVTVWLERSALKMAPRADVPVAEHTCFELMSRWNIKHFSNKNKKHRG